MSFKEAYMIAIQLQQAKACEANIGVSKSVAGVCSPKRATARTEQLGIPVLISKTFQITSTVRLTSYN